MLNSNCVPNSLTHTGCLLNDLVDGKTFPFGFIYKETALCYGLNVYIPPKINMLTSNPYSDGIWRWGLWELIRSWVWGPHEWDQWSYKRLESSLSLSLCYNRMQHRSAVWISKESPYQNSTMLAPWSQTSSLQNGEKNFCLFCSTLLQQPDLTKTSCMQLPICFLSHIGL